MIGHFLNIRGVAVICNAISLFEIIFAFATKGAPRGNDTWIVAPFILGITTSLYCLVSNINTEEINPQREVRIARLRKELSELSQPKRIR